MSDNTIFSFSKGAYKDSSFLSKHLANVAFKSDAALSTSSTVFPMSILSAFKSSTTLEKSGMSFGMSNKQEISKH